MAAHHENRSAQVRRYDLKATAEVHGSCLFLLFSKGMFFYLEEAKVFLLSKTNQGGGFHLR